MALHVFDRHERDLPDLGLVQFADPETGEQKWIDTSRKKVREEYANARRKWEKQLNERLTRCGWTSPIWRLARTMCGHL